MEWRTLYDQNNPPTLDMAGEYVGGELWGSLHSYLQNRYQVKPKISYSRCSMQPGWNVKYQKSGKSLCTLYPMEGFFIALVVIGSRERFEAERMLPLFSSYTQSLYQSTAFSSGGRWLMMQVTEPAILNDVIRMVQIRAKSK